MPAMYLSREQVRTLDRRAIEELGVPGIVLMENAGRGAADLLMKLMASRERKRPEVSDAMASRERQRPEVSDAMASRERQRPEIIVCCGKGNNGGDGFVMARHLDNARVPVRVLLFGRPQELTGDAAINYAIVERSGLEMRTFAENSLDPSALQHELSGAEWIVDALFGTGLRGQVRKPYDAVIAALNASGARVCAVDIPSGLDCDTGRPLGPTVRADHTATFVAAKIGFGEPAAKEWLGTVHVLDIGAPRVLVEQMLSESVALNR